MRSHQAESEHTVVRAHLDSGCRDDWISQKVVERAGLREQLRPVENFGAFIGFGGQVLEPRHVIDVTWFAKNATVSRTTSFLVHEHVPFDMVLGKVFIRKESIFMLNEPALALRQGDFTQDQAEELQEIEVEARRKKATSEQITSVREARGAAARDRLRQQKAASRLASTSQLLIAPGTTGSRSSTDVSMLSRRHVAQAQSFSSRNQSQEVVAGTIGSEPRLDRDRLRTSAVTDFESPRTGNEGNSTEAAKWAR
ncbi:hypothetical protein EV356DRAFT_511799 [Viridothelium virens]|uniref:Uncharacterized protein n=1 Tax=Viridothelium virens TaxID=1048519 RepID=A0A6A6GUB2_VIRVR|nr:hypothetical protein EV356DRAFT_511799 [Viridothelium virens]